FRMAFHKDVVIDLSCYRRHGHNEADEPTMTQPIMYQKIKQHPTARDIYARQLEEKARVPKDYGATLVNENRDMLDQGNVVARDLVSGDSAVATLFDWTPYLKQDWRLASDTRLDKATYQSLIKPLTEWPADVTPHARVAKTYQDRKAMMAGEQPMDWGCGETLGFASLLAAGYNIRLSGQDCGRGTFSHRHSVIHDQANGSAYVPLNHLSEKQGTYTVIDSLLSEEAVLAYEYGFASTDPETLTIWEGQFGDFVNGAQVVIDQFISSGEQKWGRQCGLVMLLPHGYEGQGPEHSSARLERFMQLCAQYNMQVCVPSTPAQIFHVLRRQMLRKIRRPLVIMSPKSLLRHKLAVSTPAELTDGQFSLVIDDNTLSDTDAKSINRIVLSSGKVYYDLFEGRRDMKHEMCALVRVEQLYPFPEEELKQVMARYPNATEVVWCQEEPKNQGAWYSSQHHFHACLRPNQTLRYAGRPASASPAVGYPSMHQQQQNELVYDALN
ncbi:MAG: thiamine pyrophosphate-dependent enzyme, partial [Pseudomonadota bacterium]